MSNHLAIATVTAALGRDAEANDIAAELTFKESAKLLLSRPSKGSEYGRGGPDEART